MRLMLPIAVFALAAGGLSGCDEGQGTASAYRVSDPHRYPDPEPQDAGGKPGKDLVAYAPATDFTGASNEDASSKSGAMFDGSKAKDGAAKDGAPANGAGAVSGSPAGKGKKIKYTAGSSAYVSDLKTPAPPLPDTYDYSKSGATPGSAKGAGKTLLEFAAFQIEQKFPSVAPIMSRMGWRAAPRVGKDALQPSPYRVTVHHTMGRQSMTEAEDAAAVKGTQHYHMVGRGLEGKDNFQDIGYHFLIAGDGRVIEGRKAEYWGSHAGGANDGNIGIAMMGDFNKLKPTDAQVESLTRLVTFLSLKYKKDPMAKGFLEPHMHYNDTDCPGKNMMAILESLRKKIDRENEVILAGGTAGADFTPLAVVASPAA